MGKIRGCLGRHVVRRPGRSELAASRCRSSWSSRWPPLRSVSHPLRARNPARRRLQWRRCRPTHRPVRHPRRRSLPSVGPSGERIRPAVARERRRPAARHRRPTDRAPARLRLPPGPPGQPDRRDHGRLGRPDDRQVRRLQRPARHEPVSRCPAAGNFGPKINGLYQYLQSTTGNGGAEPMSRPFARRFDIEIDGYVFIGFQGVQGPRRRRRRRRRHARQGLLRRPLLGERHTRAGACRRARATSARTTP